MRLLTILVAAAFLAGCSKTSPVANDGVVANSSADAAQENSDPACARISNEEPAARFIEVEATGGVRNGNGRQFYGVFGLVERKTGDVLSFVQWSEEYSANERRNYWRATDRGATLPIAEVGRKLSSCNGRTGCPHSETFNIYFTPEQMKRAALEGLAFRISGRKGDERIVSIPANTILGFNEKMDEATRKQAAEASPLFPDRNAIECQG